MTLHTGSANHGMTRISVCVVYNDYYTIFISALNFSREILNSFNILFHQEVGGTRTHQEVGTRVNLLGSQGQVGGTQIHQEVGTPVNLLGRQGHLFAEGGTWDPM